MVALVTLDQIRGRLRIDAIDDQADVESMAAEATDIVIGYLKIAELEWTVDTVPDRVRTAILLVVQALYDGAPQPISSAVQSILWRDRDPALA